jgi:hypothetical protein
MALLIGRRRLSSSIVHQLLTACQRTCAYGGREAFGQEAGPTIQSFILPETVMSLVCGVDLYKIHFRFFRDTQYNNSHAPPIEPRATTRLVVRSVPELCEHVEVTLAEKIQSGCNLRAACFATAQPNLPRNHYQMHLNLYAREELIEHPSSVPTSMS